MADLDQLRAMFADGERWFHDSPLYRVLARVVTEDDDLLALAGRTPPGPQPTNMLMAATHMIVLRDPSLLFARFFATIAGDRAQAPEHAGAEYGAFCAAHHDAIAELLATRLVQTNEPARAAALRYALHEVARRVEGPVSFLEVGSSAGIQLRFDRWAVDVGGRRFGPDDAPLRIETEWRGDEPPPDLDAIPALPWRLGVDLRPVDATDATQRLWLQALVWPEHTDRFERLGRALDVVARDPPEILAGDAIELLPALESAGRLPAERPLVVFHSQVRMHVPAERREAFDASIDALGTRRRLLRVALEHRDDGPAILSLSDSAGESVDLGRAHGHGRWIAPTDLAPTVAQGRWR